MDMFVFVFFCLQAAGYVFTPTETEKSDRLLHVRYNAVKDQYCRVSNNSEVIRSWDQCLWRKESVFRKVENDWEMVCSERCDLVHIFPVLVEFVFHWHKLKMDDRSSLTLTVQKQLLILQTTVGYN